MALLLCIDFDEDVDIKEDEEEEEAGWEDVEKEDDL